VSGLGGVAANAFSMMTLTQDHDANSAI
jgi:hypothetical protein